jgi:hypothetical protein
MRLPDRAAPIAPIIRGGHLAMLMRGRLPIVVGRIGQETYMTHLASLSAATRTLTFVPNWRTTQNPEWHDQLECAEGD